MNKCKRVYVPLLKKRSNNIGTFEQISIYLSIEEITFCSSGEYRFGSASHYFDQSHYREVPRWEIFMEQELRFGLDLGRMADFPAFIASKSFDL